MEVSDSLSRRDKSLQLVTKDRKPLNFMNRIKGGGCDDIETLEELIDVEKDLKRYQQ